MLIILSVIVVGIAVGIGISMFSDSSINADRDGLTNDLSALASRAEQYYLRPSYLGGGGNSFSGLTADAAGIGRLTNQSTNNNGTYTIASAGTGSGPSATVEILGVGTVQSGSSLVSVRVRVYPDHDSLWVVN
jgi:Tfp pilus assembly protein PilE